MVRDFRRGVLLAILVSACLALSGCSRAADDHTAAPSAPAPAATDASAVPSPEGSDALQYVALGDSLASGLGGEPSYVDFYRDGLQQATRLPVDLTNLGRPGWWTGQLLAALRSSEKFREAVAQADVITWNIGGNDIVQAVIRKGTGTCGGSDGLRCMRQTSRRFAELWSAVITELVELRHSDSVPLRTFDLYSPFILPDARTEPVLEQLDAMNATITASHGRNGVAVAPVAQAFAGAPDPLLDDDGLHPSRRGHRLIADLLLALDPPTRQ